jgi:pSer/pThr/pTyr-binding forkhead associated (FHA) protein
MTVCSGPHNKQTFECVTSSDIVVGRGYQIPPTEIILPDDEISARHCCIYYKSNSRKWAITDLNSSNGTIINNVCLKNGRSRTLRSKDTIKIGQSHVSYVGGRGRRPKLIVQTLESCPANQIILNPKEQDTYVVGRVSVVSSTKISLNLDNEVSAEHCMLFTDDNPNNEDVYIKDLASTNGTAVNGKMLRANESMKLLLGDMIAIGQTYMTLVPLLLSPTRGSVHAASLLATNRRPRQQRRRATSIGRRSNRDSPGQKNATPSQKVESSPEYGYDYHDYHDVTHRLVRQNKINVMKTVVKQMYPSSPHKNGAKESTQISPSMLLTKLGNERAVALRFDEDDLHDDDGNDDGEEPCYNVDHGRTSCSVQQQNSTSGWMGAVVLLVVLVVCVFMETKYRLPSRETTVAAQVQALDVQLSASEKEMAELRATIAAMVWVGGGGGEQGEAEELVEEEEEELVEEMVEKGSVSSNILTAELFDSVNEMTTVSTYEALRVLSDGINMGHTRGNIKHVKPRNIATVKQHVADQMDVRLATIMSGGVSLPNYAAASMNAVLLDKMECIGDAHGNSPFDRRCGLNMHRLLNADTAWEQCWRFVGTHRFTVHLSSCVVPTQITCRGWHGEEVGGRYQTYPSSVSIVGYPVGAKRSSGGDSTTFSYNILQPPAQCVDTMTFEIQACASTKKDCVAVLCGLMVH